MATILIGNPYVDIHAPTVRFSAKQIQTAAALEGVVAVEGIGPAYDGGGTFAGMRIFFADNAVMEKYLAALAVRFGGPR